MCVTIFQSLGLLFLPRYLRTKPRVSCTIDFEMQREVCRKGLHPMTPANLYYEGKVRRCFMCRSASLQARLRRKHKPRPPETGKCMKGLHVWKPENWYVDKKGTTRCKPCRDTTHRITYARNIVIRCVVKGCKRLTHRASGNYICLRHRINPPEWIQRLGLSIVGTCLVSTV